MADSLENQSLGESSTAEGRHTCAEGVASHSEGLNTNAKGACTHAEGITTAASGDGSHSEGIETKALGGASHSEGMGTEAKGDTSHVEGEKTTSIGRSAHAEGQFSTALGTAGHAEGQACYAKGEAAHAEGRCTIANGENSHTEGSNTTANGEPSHSEGSGTFSSGFASHAEGFSCRATGDTSHAEGYSTNAIGKASHSEGCSTTASASYSHAEGEGSKAEGTAAHSEGGGTLASGFAAHAEGYKTVADSAFSHAEGINTSTNGFIGTHISGRYGDADESYSWYLANGLSDDVKGVSVKIAGLSGNIWTIGSVMSTSTSYAEFFETADGCPIEPGYFVTVTGCKIRKANNADKYILGVTASVAAFTGADGELGWNNRFLREQWGSTVFVSEQMPAIEDEDGKPVVGGHVEKHPALNPQWSKERTYIPRSGRREWVKVSLIGQVLVRDDGTCYQDGYCMPNKNGVATESVYGYRVLERLSSNQILIVLK